MGPAGLAEGRQGHAGTEGCQEVDAGGENEDDDDVQHSHNIP